MQAQVRFHLALLLGSAVSMRLLLLKCRRNFGSEERPSRWKTRIIMYCDIIKSATPAWNYTDVNVCKNIQKYTHRKYDIELKLMEPYLHRNLWKNPKNMFRSVTMVSKTYLFYDLVLSYLTRRQIAEFCHHLLPRSISRLKTPWEKPSPTI